MAVFHDEVWIVTSPTVSLKTIVVIHHRIVLPVLIIQYCINSAITNGELAYIV